MQLGAHLERTYLSRDPRSLGLFRIGFACVLAGDLLARSGAIAARYGAAAAAIAMAASAGVCAGLGLGYRTRVMQGLALLCLIGTSSCVAPRASWAGGLLNLLAIWTLLLPLGQRFSLDALLASMRARPELDALSLYQRAPMRAPNQHTVSLAALAVLLQLCVVAVYERVPASGAASCDGIVPALCGTASLMLAVSAVGTFSAALIASPVLVPAARALALSALLLLHVALALCFSLGSFAYAMCAACALLLEPEHWDAWARRRRAQAPVLECFFDSQCGICFQVARVLARLDVFERVEIIGNDVVERLPPGVDSALVAQTLVVQDRRNGRVYTEAHAVAALCRALPCGIVPWAVLEFPLLAPLWRALYRVVARNRTAISGRLGLAVCGIPQPKPLATAGAADARDAAPARPGARVLRLAGELGVAILLFASAGEVLSQNAGASGYQQPRALQAIIDCGGLSQAWSTPASAPLCACAR